MFRFLAKKNTNPRVTHENAIQHLSEKFDIAADDMSATYTPKVKGYKGGKEHYADTFYIKLKQPSDRPNLHQEMHVELTSVFRQAYKLGIPFYYGVCEDKEHREKLMKTSPKIDVSDPDQFILDI